MIIQGRRFALQFPRRVDLSGRPFGALFIWFTDKDVSGRFAPISAREFGFYVPTGILGPLLGRLTRTEWKECLQLYDRERPFPHDWKKWPDGYVQASQEAVDREVKRGAVVVKDISFCDRRIDLSSQPLQLTRAIKIRVAA